MAKESKPLVAIVGPSLFDELSRPVSLDKAYAYHLWDCLQDGQEPLSREDYERFAAKVAGGAKIDQFRGVTWINKDKRSSR